MRPILTLALSLVLAFQAQASTFNVRDFGAKGDGCVIDSEAINQAIERAALQGGGTVLIPSGTYLCYSIRLQSHIHLIIEKGATVVAAKPEGGRGFDLAEPGPEPQYQDYGHSHWKNSLIWGIGLEDIVISGEGLIDGSNLSGGFGDTALEAGVGNKSISLKDCRRVTIKDVTIFKGGHFCILATGVDALRISALTIDTMRDGIDIDCCRNVRVSDCLINSTFDDGLVLKASYALERFVDTQDVTITGCNLSAYATGSVLDATYRHAPLINPHTGKTWTYRAGGRIKLGTESSGGFKNIAITSCTFRYCGGLLLESMDGGLLEDVVIQNLTMRECTDSPLFIRLGERMRSPGGTQVGAIRRVLVSDVNVSGARSEFGMILSGTPGHQISGVTLRNIHVQYQGGISSKEALKTVPENEKSYPDPWMFGSPLPSSGMFLRHVTGLDVDGLHFSFIQEDSRNLIIREDVTDSRFQDITLEGKPVSL